MSRGGFSKAVAAALVALAFGPTTAWALEAPTIESLTPSEGSSGGGTKVIVKGTEYEEVETGGVSFGTTALKKTGGALTKGTFKVKSPTEIEASAPFHEAGKVNVSVTNPKGTSAAGPASAFTYLPEFYKNEVAIGTNHVPIIGYGQLLFEAPTISTQVECLTQIAGSVWNEPAMPGRPAQGWFKLLGFYGSSHVPANEFPSEFAGCRLILMGTEGRGGFSSAWVTAEPVLSAGARQNKLSTEWDGELRTGSGTSRSLLIGQSIANPAQTCTITEEEPVAPEGCVKVTIVAPYAGFERTYQGALQPKLLNGGPNGLAPSALEFERPSALSSRRSPPNGVLEVLNVLGTMKILGYSGQELISAK